MKGKRKSWVKFRHKVFYFLARIALYPILKIRYKCKINKIKDKRQCFILINHQTSFDQCFVVYLFKRVIYFIATEDILSKGFVSKLIKYTVAPIAFNKCGNDLGAVRNCLKVVKEGGSIAMMPEGNRTYDGQTCAIKPSVAKLVKACKLPVYLLNLHGGYGVQPRWANDNRKGKVDISVAKVLEYDEYKDMAEEDLYKIICDNLYIDESAPGEIEYESKEKAEYIERVLYVCPDCGLAEFESNGNTFRCKKCGKTYEYTARKEIKGVGFDAKFSNVKEWVAYQNEYVNKLDLSLYYNKAMYEDKNVRLSNVILYKKKKLIDKNCTVYLFGNRVEFSYKNERKTVLFDEAKNMAVLGKNKIDIYCDDATYQLKGEVGFNALKIMNIYYRYKNIKSGESDNGFLGI